MSPEKTKLLIDKFPIIFKYVTNPGNSPHLPISLFIFECGDGWYHLIDSLCGQITHHLKYNAKPDTPPFVCSQVKEKFGTLRFYGDGGDDKIDAFIWFAESFSGRICEQCGAPGKTRGGTWLYTSCNEHAREGDKDGDDQREPV